MPLALAKVLRIEVFGEDGHLAALPRALVRCLGSFICAFSTAQGLEDLTLPQRRFRQLQKRGKPLDKRLS